MLYFVYSEVKQVVNTIKIKSIAIGELMCLLPILLGLSLRGYIPYDSVLPFLSGKFSERDFLIFGIPFFMAFLHIFFSLLIDVMVVDRTRGKDSKFLIKAIVPVLNFIIYLTIIIYALGSRIVWFKVIAFVIGTILITVGLFAMNTEKFSFARMKKFASVKSRQEMRFNIFVAFELLVLGALFVANAFLSVVFTAIFIFFSFAAFIITFALAKSITTGHRRF